MVVKIVVSSSTVFATAFWYYYWESVINGLLKLFDTVGSSLTWLWENKLKSKLSSFKVLSLFKKPGFSSNYFITKGGILVKVNTCIEWYWGSYP